MYGVVSTWILRNSIHFLRSVYYKIFLGLIFLFSSSDPTPLSDLIFSFVPQKTSPTFTGYETNIIINVSIYKQF